MTSSLNKYFQVSSIEKVCDCFYPYLKYKNIKHSSYESNDYYRYYYDKLFELVKQRLPKRNDDGLIYNLMIILYLCFENVSKKSKDLDLEELVKKIKKVKNKPIYNEEEFTDSGNLIAMVRVPFKIMNLYYYISTHFDLDEDKKGDVLINFTDYYSNYIIKLN